MGSTTELTTALGRHGSTLAVSAAAAGLSLASQLLVAAGLGVTDYGYFAAVYAVAQLVAPLATVGLTPILPRLVVEMSDRQALDEVRGVVAYGAALGTATAAGAALVALSILGAAPGGGVAGPSAVLVVVTMAIRRLFTMTLVGREMARTAVFAAEGLPAGLLAVGALVIEPTSASAALGIAAAAGVVGALWMLGAAFWSIGPGRLTFACREWFRQSRPAFGARATDSLLTRVDLLVVGPTLGLAALGTFSAAMRIAQGLQVLVTSTSAASAHAMARQSSSDAPSVRAEYRFAVRFSLVLGVPVVVFLVVFRNQIVDVLVPDDFVGAAGVLAWCAVAQLANVASGPSSTLMYVTGRASSLLRIGVFSVVSACATVWVLGEWFGVVGAAAGYAIGFWIRAALQVWSIERG